MKSHERREVDCCSASQWLLEYLQITKDHRRAWPLNKHFRYGIFSIIIFHVSKHLPSFFGECSGKCFQSKYFTALSGEVGDEKGLATCFCFIAVFEISKKGPVDTATHSACSLPEMISQHACMPLNCIHIWPSPM